MNLKCVDLMSVASIVCMERFLKIVKRNEVGCSKIRRFDLNFHLEKYIRSFCHASNHNLKCLD